jgi:hypothetical protein
VIAKKVDEIQSDRKQNNKGCQILPLLVALRHRERADWAFSRPKEVRTFAQKTVVDSWAIAIVVYEWLLPKLTLACCTKLEVSQAHCLFFRDHSLEPGLFGWLAVIYSFNSGFGMTMKKLLRLQYILCLLL